VRFSPYVPTDPAAGAERASADLPIAQSSTSTVIDCIIAAFHVGLGPRPWRLQLIDCSIVAIAEDHGWRPERYQPASAWFDAIVPTCYDR